jgi:hypothetical protein
MFYPNLLFKDSLNVDSSGNNLPLRIIPTIMETIIPNVYHKGLPVHQLDGLLAIETVDTDDLRVSSGKFTIEANVRPDVNNTAIATTGKWPEPNEYVFWVSSTQVGVWLGQGGYGILLDRWNIPVNKRNEFYHVGLVVNGSECKYYVDGVLTGTCTLDTRGNKIKTLLSSYNVNNSRYGGYYKGQLAGFALHGGLVLTPDKFTLLNPVSTLTRAVQLSEFVPEERKLDFSDSLILLSVEVQGPNIVFKFNNDKSYVITRPVLTKPGRNVIGAAVNADNHVILTYSDQTTENLGVLPIKPGSTEMQWLPGVGYLSSATENRKYIPIRVSDKLIRNDNPGTITIGVAPIVDTPIVFLNKLTLEWVVTATDRISPINTPNTWSAYTWNRLYRDANVTANLGNINRIILPAGNYYIEGNMSMFGGGNAKARIFSITQQRVLAESDMGYQNNSNGGVVNLMFNDLIELTAVDEIEVQFITTLSNQSGTILNTLGIVQGSYSKLSLFKV